MNGRRSHFVELRPAVLVALVVTCVGASSSFAAEQRLIDSTKIELFVRDPAASARFYAILGFDVIDTHADGYTTLANGTTVISLSPATLWLPAAVLRFLRAPLIGTEIVLYTRHLRDVRASLAAAGYEPGSIGRRPWGAEDFRLHDPAGYYVRITEVPPDG